MTWIILRTDFFLKTNHVHLKGMLYTFRICILIFDFVSVNYHMLFQSFQSAVSACLMRPYKNDHWAASRLCTIYFCLPEKKNFNKFTVSVGKKWMVHVLSFCTDLVTEIPICSKLLRDMKIKYGGVSLCGLW